MEKIQVVKNLQTGEALVFNEIQLPDTYIQVYMQAQEMMARVTNLLSYHLFMFIITNMNKDNKISLGNDTKLEFLDNLERLSGKRYSLPHVSTAMKELKKIGMLERINNPTYVVNLAMVWKDSTKERRRIAKEIMLDDPNAKNYFGLESKETYKLEK